MPKLFENGAVEAVCHDSSTRQCAVKIRAPLCVAQSAFAIMLGHGFIDDLRISNPLSVWVPCLPSERFKEEALREVPNLSDRVTSIVQARAVEMLQLFSELLCVLKNPDDVSMILPVGTYVDLQFRSTYEGLASVVEKLEPVCHHGTAELRYAMAEVLAELLAEDGSTVNLDGSFVPMLLSSPDAVDADNLTPAASATSRNNLLG